jgi:hypothetical protein
VKRRMRSRGYLVNRRHLKTLAAVAVTVGGLLIPASLRIAQATPATSGIVEVGRLGRMPADAMAALGPGFLPPRFFEPLDDPVRNSHSGNAIDGTLLALPEARQLWQIYLAVDGSGRTGIVVRDPATLAISRTLVLASTISRGVGHSTGGGEWAHAIDGGRRVFLIATAPAFEILEVDLATFEVRHRPIPAPYAVNGRAGSFTFGGMSYDHFADALVFVFGAGQGVTDSHALIHQLPLNGGTGQSRQVRACNGPLPSNTGSLALPVMSLQDGYYLACHRAGVAGTVVRLGRESALDPTGREDVVVGPTYLDSVLADEPSGRLFLATIAGEIWAFDAKTMSFIGVVTASGDRGSGNIGYGLDRLSGRLYFQSDVRKVGVAEGRFFPIAQARTGGVAALGQERIVSDAPSGRFFVLTGVTTAKAYDYRIFEAGVPPVPPPPPNPDRNTADLDEKGGVTETRYFANGSGYGARVLLAKGWAATPPAPTAGVLAPTAQVLADNVNSKCGFTDRELVAGRVRRAEYDAGSTRSEAIAVDVDERTRLDMERASRCDLVVKNQGTELFSGIFSTAPAAGPLNQGKAWGREPATCTSNLESGPTRGQGRDTEQPLGTSEVSCPDPGGRLVSWAESELNGAVSVGKARTDVEITTVGGKGTTSRVTAIAQDINIAGVIRIAEVRSEATSRSNGRPQRASMSTHTINFKGVEIAGARVCGESCDPAAVIEALNVASSGRAQFRSGGGVDPDLLLGTPKGALTAVQKSQARQVSDQALVADFTTEIPGLEMIFYNDNIKFGRARQLYQFAGVSTFATYNIVPLPKFEGSGDDPGGELSAQELNALSDLPIVAAIGGVGDNTDLRTPSSQSIELAGSGGNGGGGPGGVLRAIGRGIRLFLTSPRSAGLLLTGWGLLFLPPVLSRRRRLLAAARSA